MSASPQPSGPSVSPLTSARSPPTSAVISPNIAGHSNAQLAEMLSASFREVEALRRELTSTRRRAEKAENILSAIQSGSEGSNSQQQMPEAAVRAIMDCEHRVHAAEQARDEAEVRRRVLMEAWVELDRYLGVIEIRAADARAGYSRIVAEGGGQLVVATIPLPGQPPPHNHQNPSISVMPPPNSHPSRHHTSSHSRNHSQRSAVPQTSHTWPPLPPPNPNQSRVRPRAGSLDDAGYSMGAAGQPPAKRSRGERERDGDRDRRAMFSESYHPRTKELDHDGRERDDFNRGRLSRPSRSMDTASVPYNQRSSAITQSSRLRGRSRSYSRSPSQDSAGSKDIDEMILDAADDRRQLSRSSMHGQAHHRSGEYHISYRADSPSSEYPGPIHPHSSHLYSQSRARGTNSLPHLDAHSPGGGPPGASVMSGPAMHSDTTGPLPQPGQVQTYQTHIFAPPVTGAPVKKNPNGSIVLGPPPVPSSGSYPAQNAQGQRICRQCGHPGRYKDGKCVEKWGPGPEGPGTVCDRCRKKMKRVERRGTLDSQHSNPNSMASIPTHPSGNSGHVPHPGIPVRGSQHSLSSDRSVHRSDTLPASHHPMSSRSSGGFGPAGTHLISSGSFPQHDRFHEESHPRPSSSSAAVHDRSPRDPRSPPSPPAIATLPGTGEEASDAKTGTSRNGGRGSRHASTTDHRPSPINGHSHRSRTSRDSAPPAASDSNGPPPRQSPPGSDHSAATVHNKQASTPLVDADADAEADPDADADADADAEADVDDPDLELQEAVDAAEANSSSAEPRPKTEEDDVDDLARA